MKNENRLKSKDLINIALFTILIYVIQNIVSLVLSPMTFYALPLMAGITTFFTAVVYLLMAFKVGKKWTMTLMGTIIGIFYALMGVPVMLPFCILISFIAELTLWSREKNKYRKFSAQAVAYSVYGTLYGTGTYATALLFGRQYFENVNYTPELIDRIFYFMSSPVWMIGAAAFSFCLSYLGMILGRAILKKHFIKSGIIKGF